MLNDLAQSIFGGQADVVPKPQTTSTIYATATTDSVDGVATVVLEGDSVSQPSEEEETEEFQSSEFVNGRVELRQPAFPGSVTVVDSNGVQLLEDEFQVDDNILTIDALQGARQVEVSYIADISYAVDSNDFDEDVIALQNEPIGEVIVTLDGEEVPSSYSDGMLTVEGASVDSDAVFSVSYSVPQTMVISFEDGRYQLTDEPQSIELSGYTLSDDSDPVSTTIDESLYTLVDGLITLDDDTQYDGYEVSYQTYESVEFSYSDTLPGDMADGVPIEDDDEPIEEPSVPGQIELIGQPSTVTVEKDGEPYNDYDLEDGVLTVNWTPQEPVSYFVSYQSRIDLDLASSEFANGELPLPSAPVGEVSAYLDGDQVSCIVDGYMLSIPSLVSDVASYTVSYRAAIQGNEIEIPVAPSVRKGEVVQISVINGTPIGTSVIGEGDRQDFDIDIAYTTAANAEELAEEANTVATATNQHFWHRSTDPDQDGAGTGAFVTDEEQDDFLEAMAQDVQPIAARPLHNLLMNAEGILLRAAKRIRAAFTPSGVAFYDGQGNSAENIVATFGSSGATIGKTSEKHVVLDADGFTAYNEDGTLALVMGSNIEADHAAIALKANASDVYTKTESDGLISTEVENRDAAITAATNAIELSVGETYATKTELSDGIVDANAYTDSEVASAKAKIEVTTDGITSNVESLFSTTDNLSATVSTIDQKADEIDVRLSESVSTAISTANDALDAVESEVALRETWYTFGTDALHIGKSGSDLALEISNDKISFLDDGDEVAYASGGEFNAPNMATETLTFAGKWAWVQRDNGSLALKWIG